MFVQVLRANSDELLNLDRVSRVSYGTLYEGGKSYPTTWVTVDGAEVAYEPETYDLIVFALNEADQICWRPAA